MNKILRIALSSIFLCLCVCGGFALSPKKADAAIGIPFGGIVTSVTPCLNGLMVTLGPPTPMIIMYPWGALSHLYGPPRNPGQWLLGEAAPGGACVLTGFIFTFTIPTQATILYHGSSLII